MRRRVRCGCWLSGVAALLAAVLLGALGTAAAGRKVDITASTGARWEVGSELLTVEGDVRVTYDDVTLRADWLQLDLGANRLVARGNVKYSRRGQEVQAEQLTLDLDKESGSIESATARLELSDKRGTLFVSAPHIGAEDKTLVVSNASLTTCDLKTPHYHLDARRVTVYLDDRVVIEGVSYWDFGIPLFYWPRLTIPLRRQSSLELPEIGYSTSRGWFVKTAYSYYPTVWKAHGIIHLDYYSLAGWGTGIDHFYRDNEQGQGVLSFYVQPNRQTGHTDLVLGWSEEWHPHENLAGAAAVRYESGSEAGRPTERIVVEGKASYSTDRARLQLSLNRELHRSEAELNGSADGKDYLQAGASLTLRLSPRTDLSGRVQWRESRAAGTEERRMQYQLSLVQLQDRFRWTVGLEQQLNPDLDQKDTPVDWLSFRRSPYLTIAGLHPLKLPFGFGANWAVEVARLGEIGIAGTVQTGWRGAADLALITRSWPLLPSLTLQVNGTARAAFYDSGGTQAALTSEAGLIWKPGSTLTLSLRHRDRTVFGYSPFLFDRELPEQVLAGSIDYRQPQLQLTLAGGYDLYWRAWRPVVAEVSWTPTEQLGITSGLVIDTQGKGVRAVAGSVRWTPGEDRGVEVGVAYAPLAQSLDQLKARIALPVGTSWKINSDVLFDGPTQRFTRASVSLVRDLHCRTVSLRYDAVGQAVWLQYQISAFPDARVGLGTGAGGTVVDVDALRDFLERFAGGNPAPATLGAGAGQL
ncbi:MAG: LPS-assembly protein LptD [Limnochordales bacterium]|nr:LPS-assembly protein LptD [Limnochordales bacterium]